MTTQPTKLTAAFAQRRNSPPYAGFGAALRSWLLRADQNQQQLAAVLEVSPSAVSHWAQGRKRPDAKSLAKLLATCKGLFGVEWDPLEALDAVACLGYDWSRVQAAFEQYFEKGGRLRPS